MAQLSEHTVILRMDSGDQRPASRAAFYQMSEDDPAEILEAYYFPTQLWEDMGSPEVITLSIKTGDTLNGSES